MQLSVIIVNYNVKYFLEQCLFSVQKAIAGIAAEVLVVDNASSDGSREYLEQRFNWVRFSWNDENIGFARACNQALKESSGKYILFLNPDTIVPENCFNKCFSFFNDTPGAGAIGIRMLDGSGQFLPESKRSFPSPLTSFYKLGGLSAIFPKSKTFNRYHLGYLNEHENHEIDVMSGAFMMIQKEVLSKTGGFDESFFMYGEDVDLSYRIQQAGYKIYYFSKSSILHFKGESTRKSSFNYVRMFYLAMGKFVNKHYSTSKAGLFTNIINVAIFMRALLSATKRLILQIGLPLLDALFVFLSFWVAKIIWVNYIRRWIEYDMQLVFISFAVFTVLFLIVSYYTGLYEKKFRYQNLRRSTIISAVIILAVYSLLPENYRFSRGIVVFGSVFSYAVLVLWRWLLLQMDLLQKHNDKDLFSLVAGTKEDLDRVNNLLQHTGRHQTIEGFVSPLQEEHSLGSIADIQKVLQNTPTKELILCQGNHLSFAQIIGLYERTGKQVTLHLHAQNSSSIIGSDSKNEAGQVLNTENYRLSTAKNLRLKRLIDLLSSVLFVIFFPVHFLLNRHPVQLIIHCLQIIMNRKTWIGFSTRYQHLPVLKPSVLNPAGVPHSQSQLTAEGLQLADEWYAREYRPGGDITILFANYKKLGEK
jgi:O-antigen biosynthesis protein